jgi:hypothetical protein
VVAPVDLRRPRPIDAHGARLDHLGNAHDQSTVLLESMGYLATYVAYGESTTIVDEGNAYAVRVYGSSTLTVRGGRVGIHDVTVDDDAHLIVFPAATTAPAPAARSPGSSPESSSPATR